MEAVYKPNPNDINAPSKKDIEAFKAPKDVKWEAEDEVRTLFCLLRERDRDGEGGGDQEETSDLA